MGPDTRMTLPAYGPTGGQAPPPRPPAPMPVGGGSPPPQRPPGGHYGAASGVLTLAGRGYAWEFVVTNPYLPIEQSVDQEALRKWRVAVLRDLIRHKTDDRSACRTARAWANVSWYKIARFVHPSFHQQRAPKTPRAFRTAIAMAYLALQVPGGTPSAFAGGPRAYTTRPNRRKENLQKGYQPLVPLAVTDPATGKPAQIPKRLYIDDYRALFPDAPVPGIEEKRRRPDRIVVHANFAGLWKGSAQRIACGKQGGFGKKKVRPAPEPPSADRTDGFKETAKP